MLRHGALGTGDATLPLLNHEDLFEVTPLFFKLMPAKAVRVDRPYTEKIKPIISQHLTELKVNFDEELLLIIKSLCDQYQRTSPQNPNRPYKFSMADIRANGAYRELLIRQNSRCAVCGHDFRGHGGETLDHVIPWRLIGDNADCSNWQLLCADCNTGKSSYLSYLMMSISVNWVYGLERVQVDSNTYDLQTRFAVLSRDMGCSHPGCNAKSTNSSLRISKANRTGLGIFDFFRTFCEVHSENDVNRIPNSSPSIVEGSA